MKVLCVYPSFPITYWGCEYSMAIIDKQALLPPLGLITVAALLPKAWQVRLCDMNVRALDDAELAWADVVFVSGMLIQRESLLEVARRARELGVPVVAGGAFASTSPEALEPHVDCVVVGEADELMDQLVTALEQGPLPKRMQAKDRPDVQKTPVPRFDLLDVDAYQSIGVQFSRGCPFNCEFCDIIEIFGRKPRVKKVPQLLAELDAVYATGFRGPLFLVDDNFIGNKVEARRLLPGIAGWMRAHGDPFFLYTEASLNLASDDALIDAMVDAGFTSVFIGIETPSKEALKETQKLQNTTVDTDEAVRKLTSRGIEVMAGFIVGFDADDEQAVERQRAFIQNAPIPLAMVGMLIALPGTQLERRLEREGRLLHGSDSENFGRTNFVTKLDEATLLESYARLLADVYSPEQYFDRAARTLELCPREPTRFQYPWRRALRGVVRSFVQQGLRSSYRGAYWRFLARVLRRSPGRFARAIGLAIHGEHLIRYTAEDVLPRLERGLAAVERERGLADLAPMRPAEPTPELVPARRLVEGSSTAARP